MTVNEVRNHKEYKLCIDKIENYPKGFKFTMNWCNIPKAKANALKIVMSDCIKSGLLECTETELSLQGEITAEHYVKL